MKLDEHSKMSTKVNRRKPTQECVHFRPYQRQIGCEAADSKEKFLLRHNGKRTQSDSAINHESRHIWYFYTYTHTSRIAFKSTVNALAG